MKVGIFLVDHQTLDSQCGYISAAALVQSIRRVMPGITVVQFTDEHSAPLEGVEVQRLPNTHMALLRMQHHASVDGDWLFLDADVLVQQDVTHVFDQAFDVALTKRDWTHLKKAGGFTKRMPTNTGVVFSRCPAFWDAVCRRLRELPKEKRRWMGDQEVIGELLGSQTFTVKMISGARYNYPPPLPSLIADDEDDDGVSQELLAQAAIVHYKGPRRKPMLLERIRQEALTCV